MSKATEIAGGLPASLTSFVGRRAELAEVRRLLGAARLVTLTGAGGVGKTRLALEAAAASVKAFPGGVWLVDLAPVDATVAVPDEVAAAALGLPDQGTRPVREQLAAYLSGRRVLLVLDNCEHLLDACAALAHRLLSAAADLRILTTSREPLGMTGEQVVAVAPLAEAEAAELLRDRTVAVRPDFQVTDANRVAVARLCADLDGLPLAIELAAARLRTLPVEQVTQRLENRFTLLTAGSRTARPHQRTLRAAIDWSWELCGPAERLLWARLAVFTGSFALDAVEGVCAGGEIAADEVVDLLDRLVAQSLVEHAGDGTAMPRYRMLASIRHYGWDRLAELGEQQQLRRRHGAFFLALAESLRRDWFGPRQVEILARLRHEHGDLLAALEHGDAQAALALAAALDHHWITGGFLSEGRRQLDRALAAAPEPTTARTRALVAAAFVALMHHDPAAADRRLDEADVLAQELGETGLAAEACGHRGISDLLQGRAPDGIARLEQATAAHAARGDLAREVTWRCLLAMFQTLAGDPRGPLTGERAVAAAEAHGERYTRAHLLIALGRGAWAAGRVAEARHLTVSALHLLRGFRDAVGIAKAIEQLAWITASDGDHPRAGRLLSAARSLRHPMGMAVADPLDAQFHARCTADVRQALGPTGYEQALADGATADDPTRAVTYALDTGAGTRPAAPAATTSPLSRREQQVAALVAQGMTNRRIAAELVLSPRTVDTHVDRILTKLDFNSRTQIASWWTANAVADQ